ncbi:MAG: histidine--tRNA ligase [Spirochaetes bacterium]|nr:histidine--tRNA ligase [Spirochaetota bacterium]
MFLRRNAIPVVKGTKDIFTPEIELIDHINRTADEKYRQYGYKKIETPIMEYTDLFARSIGTYTDIVQKEMFTFSDRKDRSITLRPEGTAGVVRAYLENNFSFNPGITKVHYNGPMFRAERPQKGRLREFHQFGCEAIGSMNVLLDVEIIELHINLLHKLKLKDFTLLINSVGDKNCRKEYTALLDKFLRKNKSKLCENCRSRADTNPLRVFDCKNPTCQEIYNDAPLLTDHLCDECAGHFEKLQSWLKLKTIPFSINKKLVRGFDYYTKTVFEIQSTLLGAQNALLGGGRYDYLIELLGGKPTPAVGTAVGIERLMIALKEQNIPFKPDHKAQVYICTAGNFDEKIVIRLMDHVREHGYIPFYSYEAKSLKAQLKEADKLNCSFSLILGEEEMKKDQIVLRSLEKGSQENIDLNDFKKNISDYLKVKN